jgi:acyl dehydratase
MSRAAPPLTSAPPACKQGAACNCERGAALQQKVPGKPENARDGDLLHHEDLVVGRPYACGHKLVTAEEIVAYATLYDPQPMHTDPEGAKATPVGGLCASGWHTCAMMMRLVVDGMLGRVASLGSPGVDEVRWHRPVRPGDVLSVRYTVQEKRVLASRPDVGIAKVLVEAVDADGEVPASWLTNQLTRLRHPGPAPAASASGRGGARKEKPPLASLWDAPAGPRSADVYFEDAVVGAICELGSHTFMREEIVDFARQFDPQPFHLDEEAAKASLFGALCASGWHTAAHFIRGIVITRDQANDEARARGIEIATHGPSPGFRDLRWFKPVYVGDTVSYRLQLTQKIDLKSRPNRGILASAVQGRNQKGEIVLALTSLILADRREPYRANSE